MQTLRSFRVPVLAALFAVNATLSARDVAVPETLRPWKSWIAEKHPSLGCPGSADGQAVCVAYASLRLDLTAKGGTFFQSLTVYGRQWVRLPGGQDWPLEVKEGGAAVPVVLKDGVPQALLAPGEHFLTGSFAWNEAPASLPIPEPTAIVTLRLHGRDALLPEVDGGGVLQLGVQARKDTLAEESPLTVRVYRKLIDGIPMRMETQVSISVSGREREIVTGPLLPAGSAVVSIASGLPMRITADGRLRAQLRSGDHSIRVVSRFLEPIAAAGMARADSLWPEEEIWSFQAQRELRVVELSGAALIDPSQSGLPDEWKGLPAYRLQPGDTLRLEEKQRGNASPQGADLALERELWLDFRGQGMTSKDRLTGSLPLRSRLEMEGGFNLGRAEMDGAPMMITNLDGRAGVEVPAGPLNLGSLGRFDRRAGAMPATGWNQPINRVSVNMHLPPGWKLIHAKGPDQVGGSWVGEWSLWDVFLLCILVLAVLKLAGPGPAAVGLACFILLSQEDGPSGLLWLNLLAAIALWRVLPAGRLRGFANIWRWAGLAILAAIWIPFAIAQARKALYPQLDGPGSSAFSNANSSLMDAYGGERKAVANLMQMEEPSAPPPMEAAAEGMDMQEKEDEAMKGIIASRSRMNSLDKAPDLNAYRQKLKARRNSVPARVQSGPGEPEWGWESANFSWSGPVDSAERLDLFLVRPWLTRLLRALQAGLPGLLLVLLALSTHAGLRGPGGRFPGFKRGAAVALLAFAAALVPAPAQAQFPPEAMLQELETRMLAARACSPACAALNGGRISVSGERLSLALVYDIADTALATLPQAGAGQLALDGVRVGGKPAAGAVKLPGGRLAIALPRGRHAVVMEGRLLGPRLELNFGEQARNLTAQAPGYSIQGLGREAAAGGAVVLQRREGAASVRRGPELTPDPVPPFVEVARTVILDEEWTMETRVRRVAPAQGAFTVEVPLPAWEHPVTPGMAVANGSATVSVAEGQYETVWRSVIDRAETLRLAAGPLGERAEVWSVDASSRWHVGTSGLPPVLPAEAGGLPRWQPLPGDTLAIAISEPSAASGPVKTIENVSLAATPGKRESAATLTLRVRAGQGDATRVTLPPGARLESLTLDGAAQPLTQREGMLSLPLHPGVQTLVLSWKEPTGMRLWQRTPKVILEDEAANISLTLNVPGDRWTLWVGGDAIGPALLLWGVLAVLTGIAFGLGRWGVTPLGFIDWALLFLGTSMVNVYATAPLLALFLALRWRDKHAAALEPSPHNAVQVLIAGLAALGFGMLLAAVPEGLLSSPDMQVTGNGSYAGALRWFQDRAQGTFPSGWMFSLPLWVYRIAMLAWSLWLAFRLLRWLRWSWERYSAGGIWKASPPRPFRPKPAPPAKP